MKKLIQASLLFFGILFLIPTNCFSGTALLAAGATSTSWSSGGNWSGGSAGGYPAAGDDIQIGNGATFTADANLNVNSITLLTGNATTTFNVNGFTINVTNAITLNASNTNAIDKIFNVGSGTVSCASVSYGASGGNANSDTYVLISSGTLTVTGNFTLSDINTKHYISFTGAGLLKIGGTLNIGSSTTGYITSAALNANGSGATAATSGTVEFNTASASNVNTDVSYYNLKISTGAKTLDGASSTTLTVNNNLDIASGSLNFGDAATVSVTGTTNVDGTMTFNNATTTTATLTGSLSGAGTIDMSGGSLLHTLNLGGATNAITTFTTAAVASTVNYNRAGAQTVFSSANYRNLTISTSGTKTLSGAITVGENIDVSGTATLDSDQYQITGNGTGTCTIGATAFLSLGNTGNTANVLFPTAFTTANITLTAGSTVTYKAQTAQSVSATPSYSNLTINNTVNALTATVVGGTSASTALSVGSVLTIGASNTLNLGTTITTATVTSTTTLTGTLDFSSTVKAVTLTGSVSGGGTITMQGAGVAHSLTLGGTTNTVGTLNTTAASGSTITYNDNTATTAVFASTNYQNLVITGAAGFRKNMSGNVSVAGTLTINTGALFNPGGADLSVTGLTTIIGTLGDRTAAGTNALGNVEMQGGTISSNGQAVNPVMTIGGTLLCSSGTCTLSRHTITVTSGTTTISTGATLSITDDNTVKTFGGQVILQGTGTFSSTAVVTSGNLIFQGGIDASNSATFNADVATFNTADQTLTATGTYGFSGTVTVTGATVEVTNLGTVNITQTAAGSLTGTGGWIQGNGSTLNYSGSTITLSGTVTFNTNTNIVNYNRGGNQTVFNTDYYNLTINGTGTKTLTQTTGRNVLGYLTITTTTPGTTTNVFAASGAFNFTVTGTTTINNSCTMNGTGSHVLGAVTLDGIWDPNSTGNTAGTITFSGTGNRRIGSGNTGTITATALDITGSDGNIDDVILVVSTTTTVDNGHTLNITDAAGSKRFDGLVWIKAGCSWVNNINENITFRGGLTFDGTTFTSGTGTYTFNTANQDIDGTQSITFSGDVTVNGFIVDNKNDGTVTIAGVLDGTGTWKQRTNSTLTLSGATVPFSSGGFLDGYSAMEANTVNYTGASPAVYCGGGSGYYYYNLNLSGTGISTISAATSVYGTLGLYCVTTNSGAVTMATGSSIIRDGTGSLSAAITFAGTVNVTYTGTVTTGFEMPDAGTDPNALNNLTLNNTSGLVTMSKNIQCAGALTLTSGNLALTSYNLTMTQAATFSGAFSSTAMIITDGSGKLIKMGDAQADYERVYPLGTGSYYTPMEISSLTATVGAGSAISIRAVASKEPNLASNINGLTKYWEVQLNAGSISGISMNANFTYDNSEVVGTQANYVPRYWDGATHQTPAGASAAGVNPMLTVANVDLIGNWTGCDPNPATPQTYYTYGGGATNAFNDPLNWTLDPTGITLSPGGGAVPGTSALDHIVILNGKTITMVGSTNLATVTINTGGVLDLVATTGHNWTSISGGGKLRLNSVTLPTVTTMATFVASGGGTIEYYDIGGAGGTNLPAQYTYNNLLITNSTGTNHKLIFANPSNPTTYTINGTLTTSATGAGTMTLTFGNTLTNIIDMTCYGALTNGSGCVMDVASFDPIHTITMSGSDFINNGTIDFSNGTQYTASTTGAVTITFTGLVDNALTANGQTDLYEMTLNKGTNQNYVLEITGSAATNLKFYGANPITMTNGTLKLTSGYQLTGNPDRLGTATGGITFTYTVPATCHFWVNGCDINIEARHRAFTVNGLFTIDAGSFRLGGAGINIGNGGQVILNGGTTTLYQLRAGGAGVSNGSLTITGSAILNIDGSLTSTGFDTDVPAIGLLGGAGLNFTQSGGTVNVSNVISSNIAYGGIAFGISASNASVTGGAWVVDLPTTTDFHITSSIPFYDLTIKQTGAFATDCYLRKIGGNTLVAAQTLTVLNNLTLGTGSGNAFTLYGDGNGITVGGNFTINTDATYMPAGGTLTFNGSGNNQTFTLGTSLTQSANLVVNKTSGILDLAGTGTITCLKNLTITSGTFEDGGKTVNVCGDLSNSGTHTSAASGEIRLEQGVRSVTGATPSGEATITCNVANGTNAQFDLTFKEGVLVDIAFVAGTSNNNYGGNTTARSVVITTSGSGSGATAYCEISGGRVVGAWVTAGGSGYTPTAGVSAGSADLEAVYTYRCTDGSAASPSALSVNVLSHAPNYAVAPTVTFSDAVQPRGCTADISTIPTVGGSGSGVLNNLTQNNLVGCTFTASQSLTGDLRLAKGIMNIASYNLSLGANSDIYDATSGVTTAALGVGNTQFIQTGGASTDGGLTKDVDNVLTFTFPIGTGTDYRQADFTFSADQPASSLITVRGVASEHPNVTTTGMSLTYYWKTVTNGFTLNGNVDQVYHYVDADVVDDAGDRTEVDYVPGRYNSTTITWAEGVVADVDEAANTVTFQGATFNTSIDGHYTAGDNDNDNAIGVPFGPVTIYYSIASGDWDALSTWSTVSHAGAAAATLPSSNSVVQIGDGAGINHNITISANFRSCGQLALNSGSSLDVSTYQGHNFGGTITGTGTLKISSASGTAEFPAGSWSTFIGNTGGTVEYYTTGAQDFLIPSTSAAPTSLALANYNNLTLTPATGRYIEMPDLALTIYADITVQGASATGVVRLNSTTARTLTIGDDLIVTSGNLQFRNGTAQTILVADDLSIGATGVFDVATSGTVVTNLMTISGSMSNAGTFDMWNATGPYLCNVTFSGSGDETISGAGATTDFSFLTINKGSNQTPVLDYTASAFTLSNTAAASCFLTLTNGTFKLSSTSTYTVSLTTTSANCTIPSTAQFYMNAGNVDVRLCYANNNGDLYLDGKLRVDAGNFIVGDVTRNRNNDIEYNQIGSPTIEINGGSLFVNGFIRRPTTTTAGNLFYTQTSGTVTIGGRNQASIAARGIFEIANSGTFTMSSGTLLLERAVGNTVQDLYLLPASSTVNGGTIQLGSATASSQAFTIYSTSQLYNLTVAGTSNTATLNTAGVTINGALNINSTTAVFNANSLDVTLKGALTSSNTTASTSVTTGGYQAGAATQTTTFSGTAAQSITGASVNLGFGNLTISNTGGNISLITGVTPITVYGSLTIASSATLACNNNTCTVIGNVANSGTHTSASNSTGALYLAGSSQQTISGNNSGVFGYVKLNNASGAITTTDITVNTRLELQAGIFEIGSYQLTLGSSADVYETSGASAYTSSLMIKLSGALGDAGVLKNFPTGATNFTFPIGVTGKYTPCAYDVTANSAVGTITAKLVGSKHPSTQDPGNYELTYYWNIASTGFSGLTVTHTYKYADADIPGTANENNWVAGRFYPSDWNPAGGIAASVTAGSNLITLSGVAYIDGDYTAGEADDPTHYEFRALYTYYSRNATTGGNWDDVNAWSTDAILQHAGAAAVVAPNGNPIVIATGHTITANGNSRSAASTTINGTGILDLGSYIGHNLGTVSGTGTLKISSTAGGTFKWPAGTYTAFIATTGGTVEYSGATTGTFEATQTSFNNLTLSGASTKSWAAGTYTINGNLTISAGVLSNSANNANLVVKGNWTNSVGAAGWVPGTGIVTLSGTAAQTITNTGGETFYKLTVNNSAGIAFAATTDVTITNTLTMTSGNININGRTLTLGNSAGAALSYASGTCYGGTFKRWFPTGSITPSSGSYYGLFPIGTSTDYRPVSVTTTSNVTTAGYLAAVHTFVASTTDVSWADGVNTIQQVHDMSTTLSLPGATLAKAGSGGIVPLAGVFTLSMNLKNPSVFGGTVTDLHLVTGAGSPGTHSPASGSVANPVLTRTGLSAANLVGSWKVGTHNKTSTPLPIQLILFTAATEENVVHLKWTTASELNNDYFVVERSADGLNYMQLGVVDGAGNSNVLLSYTLDDMHPLSGLSYYRLKQVDFDGKYSYSNPVTVVFNNHIEYAMEVFPNPLPISSVLKVNLAGAQQQSRVLIVVRDVLGNVYYSKSVLIDGTTNLFSVEGTDNLPAGIYFVEATNDTVLLSKKIVIQ